MIEKVLDSDADIRELFAACLGVLSASPGGSDLHLRTDKVPFVRINGNMTPIDWPVLRKDHIEQSMKAFVELTTNYSETYYEEFSSRMLRDRAANFSCSTAIFSQAYHLPDVRLRLNCFAEQNGLGLVARILSDNIRPLEELGFGFGNVLASLKRQLNKEKGLFLVTGPAGSGKTTTLAACVEHISLTRHHHIVTLEDPIEIVFAQFDPKIEATHRYKSLVSQREVPRDTPSFSYGLQDALRQDPNVILVGELRSTESIELALTAAETGVFVFATLHSNSAAETLNRLSDPFPQDRKDYIYGQLATNLTGIISQRLLQRVGGGRVLCYEYLENSARVTGMRQALRKGDASLVASQHMSDPCVKWNDHLKYLEQEGIIESETVERAKSELTD